MNRRPLLVAALVGAGVGSSTLGGDPVVAPPERRVTADVPQAYSVLGESVSLTGARLLAGAPGLDDVGGGANAGGGVLFELGLTPDGDETWLQVAILRPSAFHAGEQGGRSVALGDGIAILGSPDRSDAPGGGSPVVAVMVETPKGWTETTPLTHPSAVQGSGFGAALALEGLDLAIGAPRLDRDGLLNIGAAFVWTLDAAGDPIESLELPHPAPAAGDAFGTAVAIDGDRLAVGAPGDDTVAGDGGAVWTFIRSGGVWTLESRILPPTPHPGGGFGRAVALDGDRLAIGAPRADGDGLVHVFRHDPRAGWIEETTLAGLGPSNANRDTGHAVALDGDRLAVGQPGASLDGSMVGTTAIWRRIDGFWTPEGVIRPGDSGLILLGAAVDLDGGRLAAGMPLDSPAAVHAGGVATIDLDRDCDGDGLADHLSTAGGLVADCDLDGIPDSCELAADPTLDCNLNGILDACDIADGRSEDLNLNELPDECEEELVFDVPGIFDTIGDAIDAAPEGGVVEIEPGVYEDPVVVGEVAVTIRGSEDPFDPTILRGSGGEGLVAGPVVRIAGPAASECVLENLIIEDGRDAGPLPDDPTRTGGGGLLVIDGNPLLERVTIRNCAADIGGGACLVRSNAGLVDCEFVANVAAEAGGGLATIDGHPLIEEGRFVDNVAGDLGGAIAVSEGTATIDGPEILENEAIRGGGIHVAPSADRGPVTVAAVFISLNLAQTRGGGIEAAVDGPGAAVTASIICDNQLDEIAGPVTIDAASEVCQCASDLSGDGKTDGADLGLLLASFGSCDGYCLADIDGDGQVTGADLGLILAGWGPCS